MDELIVQPMQDELALSHEYRRMHTFGCRSSPEHFRLLARQCASRLSKPARPSLMHMLAMASGISAKKYVQLHSMLPVLRVAARSEGIFDYGAKDESPQMLTRAAKPHSDDTYICPLCWTKESSKKEFGWLRRSHHLLGVEHCVHHRVSLVAIPDWRQALASPHLTTKALAAPMPQRTDSFIRNYEAILASFLLYTGPLVFKKLKECLLKRASALSLRISSTALQKLPSDLLFEVAPKDWLKKYLLGCEFKQFGRPLGRIDSLFVFGNSQPQTADVYAMIFAAFYSDSLEAINVLKSCH